MKTFCEYAIFVVNALFLDLFGLSNLRQIFHFLYANIFLQARCKKKGIRNMQTHFSRSQNQKSFIHSFSKSLSEKVRRNVRTVTLACLPLYQNSYLKSNKRKILRATFFLLLSLSFGFAQFPGYIYPASLAFLCAVCPSECLFAYIGSCVCALLTKQDGFILFTSYSLTYLLRKTLQDKPLFDKTLYKTLVCAGFASFIGAVRYASSGFKAHSILSSLAYIVLSTSICVLLCGLFSERRSEISTGRYTLCVLSVCACIVMSLSKFMPFGIMTNLIFACITTLYFSRANGLIYGCVCGFIMGGACSDTVLCTCLGIIGLLSGAVFTYSSYVAILTFAVSGCSICLYLLGIDGLINYAPEIICSSLLFIPLQKLSPSFFSVVQNASVVSRNTPPFKKDEFESVADSLSGLSDIFFKLSEKTKHPSRADALCIIEGCFKEVCSSCSLSNLCYAKKQTQPEDLYNKIGARLYNGTLSSDALSSLLVDKCIHTDKLSNTLNTEYNDAQFKLLRHDRTQNLASDYSCVSRLIKSTCEKNTRNKTRCTRLEKNISEFLSKFSVGFSEVFVFGTRDITIEVHGISADKIPFTSSELASHMSTVCKMSISEPCFDISDKADMIMRFERSDCIKTEFAQCSASKIQDQVNGDTQSFFDTDKGYFYSLICDGMGNGEKAAFTSRLSSVFLEKMLEVGTNKTVCLEMLNNLLLSKNDETFSTVDLLEIDKYNSCAHFIKAGAAPSFVLRKSKLYKICSQTPPAGILTSFTAESTKFALEKGDVILMVSDGIIQSSDDALWLSEIIRIDTKNRPELLASEILEKARLLNENKDDMTACVIKIS